MYGISTSEPCIRFTQTTVLCEYLNGICLSNHGIPREHLLAAKTGFRLSR